MDPKSLNLVLSAERAPNQVQLSTAGSEVIRNDTVVNEQSSSSFSHSNKNHFIKTSVKPLLGLKFTHDQLKTLQSERESEKRKLFKVPNRYEEFDRSGLLKIDHYFKCVDHKKLTDDEFFDRLNTLLVGETGTTHHDGTINLIKVGWRPLDNSGTCVTEWFVKMVKADEESVQKSESFTAEQHTQVVQHFHGKLRKQAENLGNFQTIARTVYTAVQADLEELKKNESSVITWIRWKNLVYKHYREAYVLLRRVQDMWGITETYYDLGKPKQQSHTSGNSRRKGKRGRE